MAIRKGDKAAGFTLPCKPGETVDVGQCIGGEKVVLLFFPLAFSPVCTTEMCEMRDGWGQWSQLDAKIFGICVDSPFVTEKFRAEHDLPFPILSDFNKEVARTYGVLHEELVGLKGVAKRSVFVIDADGTVIYDWVSDDPKVKPDFEAVRAAIGEPARA
ncbi:MAG: redoxin domain-containing protein [Planctomycetota bacterium]